MDVDVESCRVRLLAYTVVHDPGRAINPAIVEGQVAGGVVQGVGAALMEQITYTSEGQLLSSSFMDYLLPTAGESPDVQVEHLVTPSTVHELGT